MGALDERLPRSKEAFRRAAWAGLQDSMPRAALLSLHARVQNVGPDALDDPAPAQLWGPRYSTYVVPKQDFALFSVGRHPDERAERIAEQVRAHLGRKRMTDREIHQTLGTGNRIRYAATTGTVAIRWEGARAPLVWSVPRPKITAAEACRELARRHLHVFGPTTAAAFARWAGISRKDAVAAHAALELVEVRTPLGNEWLLAEDEAEMRAEETPPAAARLLPSGDSYWLLDGAERELLVPDADKRPLLWTPRVWPGALYVEGEIRGTWRRANHKLEVEPWGRLSRAAQNAVEAEAASLPLPGLERAVEVIWATA